MAKSIHLNKVAITTVAGDNFSQPLDVTNFLGSAWQFNGGATTTGTLTIQKSVDGTNYVDTAFTQALSGGKGLVDMLASFTYCAAVRLKINIATNPGAAEYYGIAKEL